MSDLLTNKELKKYKDGLATIYGIPEVSSAMAWFESQMMSLAHSNLKRDGKAYYRHEDRIRIEFVQRINDWHESLISDTVAKAEIKAKIGMVEYYDQVPNNKDMDWKGLFKDNLVQLKYELAQLKPQQVNKEN